MVTQGSTAHSVRAPDRDGAYELLRGRYEAYCGQQAAALPAMLPRDGVRALYRSARGQVTGEVVDPLALLVQECRRVLLRWSYFVGESEGDLKVDSDGLQSPRGPA